MSTDWQALIKRLSGSATNRNPMMMTSRMERVWRMSIPANEMGVNVAHARGGEQLDLIAFGFEFFDH